MKAPRISEQHLHMLVWNFLKEALPPEAVAWHTANQRKTISPREGAKLKKMGVTAGMPDLCILYRGKLICVELKRDGGRVEPTQKEMLGRLTMAGAVTDICRSLEDVEDLLSALMPLRARAA